MGADRTIAAAGTPRARVSGEYIGNRSSPCTARLRRRFTIALDDDTIQTTSNRCKSSFNVLSYAYPTPLTEHGDRAEE
jgi:hypothetical protein